MRRCTASDSKSKCKHTPNSNPLCTWRKKNRCRFVVVCLFFERLDEEFGKCIPPEHSLARVSDAIYTGRCGERDCDRVDAHCRAMVDDNKTGHRLFRLERTNLSSSENMCQLIAKRCLRIVGGLPCQHYFHAPRSIVKNTPLQHLQTTVHILVSLFANGGWLQEGYQLRCDRTQAN